MLTYTTPKILDEEHFLEAANNSARHFRNVYLAYLTVMIYIFIIILSTDQELLFHAGDKQLPLIHISVPIVAFFTWMPLALLVLHFYLLIQVKFLSDKVRLYKQRLNNLLEDKEDICEAKMLLASVPLVHILVEGKEEFKQHKMLYLIVFVSLVVFPLIVLIVTQIAFLPYQSELTTWIHRIVILIDVFLLWYFWHHIFGSHEGKTIWINSIAGLLGIVTLVFVFMFINFPGSKIYNPVTASFYELEWVNEIMPNHFDLPNRKLVKKEPAPELLAVHLEKQTDNENLINQRSSIWCRHADPLDLKGRNFREAQLRGAALCKATLLDANLTDANLNNAILISANLTSATLIHANLTEADLEKAILISANLRDADLIEAYLEKADLSGADLRQADLSRADLDEADLDKADLRQADLSGADLDEADLYKADLRQADLSGADLIEANLDEADLRQADLSKADLIEADLYKADLSKADLYKADLSRADLDEADLSGADLDKADLSEVDLDEADLSGADLTSANLIGADLIETDLTQANLRRANLIAANLSKTNFSNAVLDDRTILNFTWVWESSDSKEANFPTGIPRDWSATLKPRYLCPRRFNVSKYINKDDEVEQEKLKKRLEQIIKSKCELYKP